MRARVRAASVWGREISCAEINICVLRTTAVCEGEEREQEKGGKKDVSL
jgi:hypothetical protein